MNVIAYYVFSANSDFKMKMEIELENLQNELKRVLDENFSLRSLFFYFFCFPSFIFIILFLFF